MNRTLKLIVIVAALAVPLGVANAAEALTLAGSSVDVVNANALIALGAGYFKREGLDVSFSDLGGGSNVAAAVISGNVQIGLLGMGNLGRARAQDQNIKAFATATRGFQNYIVASDIFLKASGLTPKSPLKARIEALKGKTIAVNDVGGSAGDFVRNLLSRAGLKDTDVTMINMPSSAARLAALKAGRVAASVAYSPEPETAEADGYGEIYINSLADIPETKEVAYVVYVAKEAYIRRHHAEVVRFAKAIEMASDLVKAKPDEAKKFFFAEVTKLRKSNMASPKIEDLVWKHMMDYIAVPATLSEKSIDAARQMFHLPASVTAKDLMDTTVLK